jgi:hypothetical protein
MPGATQRPEGYPRGVPRLSVTLVQARPRSEGFGRGLGTHHPSRSGGAQ